MTKYSTVDGATGATGVAELDALLAGDVPLAFVALTVNVYAVPAVSPLTIIGELDPVPVMLPGDDVTVYPVIGSLLNEGAVNDTDIVVPVPKSVAVPIVGADGAPLVEPADEPKIGIGLFYLTLALPIVDLVHT
jgi:hypothetical protein